MSDWHRVASGPGGEVRVGHRVAAVLGAWDIAPSGVVGEDDPDGRWSLVALCRERDAFWIDRGGPFRLVLEDRQGRILRLRADRLFDDEKIGAWGVGPPEVTVADQA